jgi:tetratricopeptide (TPR) repeat protein
MHRLSVTPTQPTPGNILPASPDPASDSVSFRLAVWRNAATMVRERPWRGWGLGNFKIFYPQFRRAAVAETMTGETRMVRDLHNDWLQTAVETGLVGLALLLAMVATLARTMLAQRRHLRNSHGAWLVAAPVAGMAAFAVVACFSFPLERAIPPLLLAGYAAVLVGVPASAAGRNRGPGRTCTALFLMPRKATLLAAGLAVAALLVVAGWSAMRVVADFHFARLHQAERRGDHAGVAESSRRVLAWNPFRNEVFSFLARALLNCGEPAAAAEAAEEYLRSEPHSLPGRLNLALAYGQLGRDAEAQAILAEAQKQYPDSASVHNGLGNIALRQERADDALREFFLAVECAPANPRLHFNLGLAALAKGMPEDAERAFRMAVWLDPTWEPPYTMLDRLNGGGEPNPLPSPIDATANAPGT